MYSDVGKPGEKGCGSPGFHVDARFAMWALCASSKSSVSPMDRRRMTCAQRRRRHTAVSFVEDASVPREDHFARAEHPVQVAPAAVEAWGEAEAGERRRVRLGGSS